jgi:hypothetical protein
MVRWMPHYRFKHCCQTGRKYSKIQKQSVDKLQEKLIKAGKNPYSSKRTRKSF